MIDGRPFRFVQIKNRFERLTGSKWTEFSSFPYEALTDEVWQWLEEHVGTCPQDWMRPEYQRIAILDKKLAFEFLLRWG